MTDIFDVLNGISELEWYRKGPHSDAKGEELNRSPHVAWRFKKKDDKVIDKIKEAIESFKGKVKWEFYEHGRNLVLIPKRLIDITKERKLQGNMEAVVVLMKEEPEFGQIANIDLSELANHIRDIIDRQ